ncbi:MAG: hypothetical protein CSA81_01185 [Acidobacteria bacterium]|nr:MAG: hypothetical protein CSA81_01185 [Acidobacteriota bacterium]
MLAAVIISIVLFILLSTGCLFLTVIGLPGNWIMILLAGILQYLDRWLVPEQDGPTFGLWVFVCCILLAILGELLEYLASVLGVKKFGGTRRGMIGSILGGIAGALFGVMIPFPIIGSIIGAIIGTFLGAWIGEAGGSLAPCKDSLVPATGATIGKVLGILSKFPLALIIWFIFNVTLLLR